MGASRKDDGVLKLVYPGRFVETLTEPITAGEVMQKYPRHSVTRPDVFYFPWVVVKPESLLIPGEVFFIVPNRTIHRLLKEKSRCYCRSSSQQRGCSRDQDHQQFELASPLKECAKMTPKHRNQESYPKRLFQTLYRYKSYHDKNLKMESPKRYMTESGNEGIPKYEDDQQECERLSPGDSSFEKEWSPKRLFQTMYHRKSYRDKDLQTESRSRYETESRTKGIPRYVNDQQESEGLSAGDSSFEKTCSKAIDFYLGRRKMSTELLEKDAAVELLKKDDVYRDKDLQTESHSRCETESRTKGIPLYVADQQESERLSSGDSLSAKTCCKAVDFYLGRRKMSTELLEKDAAVKLTCQKCGTMLKSCLRKPDSARKSLDLKVAFVLPDRDEEVALQFLEQNRSGRLMD